MECLCAHALPLYGTEMRQRVRGDARGAVGNLPVSLAGEVCAEWSASLGRD